MVGRSVQKTFLNKGYNNLITPSSKQLDLRNQQHVNNFFKNNNLEIVIIAAAKVGGILANNTYRAEFIYDNLLIAANLIHASYLHNVKKLIFLGSSCIYPKLAPQPLKEEYLLCDYLEYTNEPYAIAKIAGIKLCENYFKQYDCNFFSLMPTNLYGFYDNFDLNTSHVLPALIKKFHDAKCNKKQKNKNSIVKIWGTGNPKREFLFVDDLANTVLFCLENVNAKELYNSGISHLNIGTGKDISIKDLSLLIKDIIGYKGNILFDKDKPDGTPRKLLDVQRINKLGWRHQTSLEDGIKRTYNWYLENLNKKE